jgi:DNA-binding transcriptional ArsR family regulator
VVQLPLSQSTVSQHLQKLKSAGLVDMQPYKTSSCLVPFGRFNMFY